MTDQLQAARQNRARFCAAFVRAALSNVRKVGVAVCFAATPVVATPVSEAPFGDLPRTPDAASAFNYCAAMSDIEAVDRAALAGLMTDSSGATPAADRATAMLVDAGIAVAIASDNEKRCAAAFRKGARLFEKRLAKRLRERSGKNLPEAVPADTIDGIKANLRRLWILDQAARTAYLDLRTDDKSGAGFWAFRLSVANAVMVDAESGAFIKQALDAYDWIDIERFGAAASHRAWLLVQHADTDVAFQSMALSRMEPYLATGGVSKSNYAYLWDRVAVNEGRMQRYGTQPSSSCVDGKVELAPTEDPGNLDARRADMELGPAADHIAQMSLTRCR